MSGSNVLALPRAVVLTTVQIEYQAVLYHLTDIREEVFEGTVYERGTFSSDSQSWDILILETGFEIGNVNTRTATETARALRYFEPLLVIYISLAQGLREVEIGDVVVATKVYGYEPSNSWFGHFQGG